jgi:hypothetical protein
MRLETEKSLRMKVAECEMVISELSSLVSNLSQRLIDLEQKYITHTHSLTLTCDHEGNGVYKVVANPYPGTINMIKSTSPPDKTFV